VALFNTGSSSGVRAIDFSLLGIRGKAAVRELWEKKDLGVFKKSYGQTVPSHGALLLRISAK